MAGPWTYEVNFDILDEGTTVTVPANTVQAVIGCAADGTDDQVVATRSIATLRSTFMGGPLPEAAGKVIEAGGTVLAVKAAEITAGAINGAGAVGGGVSGATNATPIVITTASAHGLIDGAVVTVGSVGGNTAANGTWEINVLSSTTFELKGSVGNSAYTSGGTVTATGSILTADASSTGVMYFSGTPIDTYYPMAVVQTGFTQGTAGGTVLISLDAGRNFGPPIAVGTGSSISLADASGYDTGLDLNFSSADTFTGGGIVNGAPVGDYVRCSTVEPQTNTASIQTAIDALVTYLANSAGTFPIVQILGNTSGSEANTIGTALDSLEDDYLFERAIVSSRDASPPTAWGGTGETAATWRASVLADFSTITAPRVCPSAGYYNIPSALSTNFAGTPSYRRPLSFALGARQVAIAPQRSAAKVAGAQGGAIKQIVVSPSDVRDGFIYHNEYLNPAFDYTRAGGSGRFAAACTHPRKAGFFFDMPLTLAPQGSNYSFLPRALVMDVACSIAHQVLSNYIASDFTTKPNGTLSDSAAKTIWGDCYKAIQSGMKGVGMISGFTVVVDQTVNIQTSKTLNVAITIQGVTYILQVDVPIGFTDTLAA